MKITDVVCTPVQSPGRTFVIIEVETDEGVTGVGEAGLQRRPAAIKGAVESLKRWLVGQDPMRTEHLWQRMARGGFYPADKLIGSTLAGIDIALWDIKGQALGVPVYELLGGRCRNYVECFFNTDYAVFTGEVKEEDDLLLKRAVAGGDPDAWAEMAVLALKNGHKYFRWGPQPGQDGRMDAGKASRLLIKQLDAVRRAVGDKLELMFDCHTRLDPGEAVWLCRAAEAYGVFLVEDPIRSEYAQGYRHIRANTSVPIAAGEQWCSKWEFRQVIEEDLIDYARIDICIAGGLTEAKKIASACETHYIKILPHNPLGPVCLAASLHLDLACGNAGPQEVIFLPHQTLPQVFTCSFRIENHRLTVPDSPGIGVKFNRRAAENYPAELTEPPCLFREDGSFTNY